MERYPSGQRGETVNLLALPSQVRILPSPPTFSGITDETRQESMSGKNRISGWAGVAQLARVSAFQAEGCGFETRLPLQFYKSQWFHVVKIGRVSESAESA